MNVHIWTSLHEPLHAKSKIAHKQYQLEFNRRSHIKNFSFLLQESETPEASADKNLFKSWMFSK